MLKNFISGILRLRIPLLFLIAGVIVWGYFTYRETPRDAFPDISPVMVPVFAEAPGLAAEEVEGAVACPIENAMRGLPGVTLVKSTSGFGMAVIYVYFKDSTDMYFARQLVSERLNQAAGLLPGGLPKPELGPISTGLGQIFIYCLEADPKCVDTEGKSIGEYLRGVNDTIVKTQLQTVPGVTAILSMGGHVSQYQIRLNPDALRRFGITFDEVVAALGENNRNVGGQYVEIGAEEFLVRGIGSLGRGEDIRNLPVRESNGVVLRLSQLGEIRYGPDIRRGVVTRNGEEEVVAGMVLKLYGENTSRVIAALHEKLASVQKSLPAGVRIVPYYDQSDLVENAGKTVENALLQGIVLVLILLAVALRNFRAALIVALAMPFCGALAMIGLRMAGMSANLMSLGGIAIALGMLVDGSIVVVENILRHLRMEENRGRDRLEVIAGAAAEVTRPIAFALFIVIAVFLPVFLFEGVEGKMFRPLAWTIVLALGGSILAAAVNAPVFAALWMKRPPEKTRTSAPVEGRLTRGYAVLLRGALRHKIFLFILAGLLTIWSLFALFRTGREFMPTLEEGSVVITVSMAPSIGLAQAERVVRNLEKTVRRHPEVTETISRIGRPEAGSHPHPVNFAEIQISLKKNGGKAAGAETRKRIVEELRKELQEYPGISMNFSQPIQNTFDELLSGTRSYFALKLYGSDLETLREKAGEIRDAVSGIPGVVDLSVEQSFGQPQLRVELKREAMARLGVTGSDVMNLIESAVGGKNAGAFFKNGVRYDLNVRLTEDSRSSPEALEQLKIRTSAGRYVELGQVASVRIAEGPLQINREKNQRVWTIQGNISGRAPSDIVRDMRRTISKQVKLPPGYYVEFGGQFENQERAMNRLLWVIPGVLILIFVLLRVNFGTFRESLIVMVNVPLALIGGVLGLVATNQLLSVPAAVGFIALLGIAMQDAVVMVSDFRDLRAGGKSLEDAVLEGSKVRFRAVILTTLTTLLGLLPLLLSTGIGAEIQKPLAAIVVFGLSSSTLLTLFFLPALYESVERHSSGHSTIDEIERRN